MINTLRLPGIALTRVLLIITIVGVVALFAYGIIGPISKSMANSRNSTRKTDVKLISNALTQQAIDDKGSINSKITTSPKIIGTNKSSFYVDLSGLVPSYANSLPVDPSGGTAGDTGFVVYVTPQSQIVVEAPNAENGAEIDSGGKTDSSISLNGLNSYVTVPSINDLEYSGGDMTIAGWIKANNSENDPGAILSKPWNKSGQYNYRLYYDANSAIRFCVNGNGTDSCVKTGNDAAPKSSWHFVVATVQSDKSMKILVDGSEQASGTHGINNWTPVYGDDKTPLTIGTVFPYGSTWQGSTSLSFDGSIDELAVYKRILPTKEIKQQYNSGKGVSGVPSTGLVAGWRFDEGSGTTIADFSGNNNAGTLVNGVSWGQGEGQ